jgi:hypothetical protein
VVEGGREQRLKRNQVEEALSHSKNHSLLMLLNGLFFPTRGEFSSFFIARDSHETIILGLS